MIQEYQHLPKVDRRLISGNLPLPMTTSLPNELLINILRMFLDDTSYQELFGLRRICKKWRKLVSVVINDEFVRSYVLKLNIKNEMYSPIHEGTSLILGQIKFCDLSLYAFPLVQSSGPSPQIPSEPFVQIQNIPYHSFYYDKLACYRATLSGYSSPHWLDEAFIQDFFVRVDMECNGVKEFHSDEITYVVQLQHDSSRGVFRLVEIRIKASLFLGRIDWIRRNEDIIMFLERLSSHISV